MQVTDRVPSLAAASDNTFVVIQPAGDAPAWFTSVEVLDEGGYEVVRRDTVRGDHEVDTAAGVDRIARDLTIWMAARNVPGRPAPRDRNVWNTA
ncbi:hypothetical protein [Streptomyces sp. NPDC048425]|uniref:hypothetical protein n=1 Tax=Streptomyces sp. NPDC048425 TaxID=3365548 RepID=UPI00371EEE62